ncbi:unnamed protein product, partial [Didymodactylos carnosus]
ARPKQTKTIEIQRLIDNLGKRYYDGVINAMEYLFTEIFQKLLALVKSFAQVLAVQQRKSQVSISFLSKVIQKMPTSPVFWDG